jgi:hypothetical protein
MKGRTYLLHVGLCGFGWTGGEIAELRLGVLRVGWCRGWLGEKVRWWHEALRQARASVKR